MNKRVLSLIIIALSLTSITAFSAEKYVSDDISVYLRRGPGMQYGLSGTLNAGAKVTVIEINSDGSFTKIKDERGRTTWIESSALSDTPSAKERVPELEKQITQLQDKVNNAQQSQDLAVAKLDAQLNQANQIITTLKENNQQLIAEASKYQNQIESMTNQLDEKRQTLILTWFLYGGLVAGGGLLLGLILPMILPRRRNKNRWMN